MRCLHALVFALVVAVGAAGACGTDDRGDPATQPAPDVTVFAEGKFGSIPVMPLSEPAGTRNEKNDVVAQSFQLRNASPDSVFDYYADVLRPDWTLTQEPTALGEADNPSFRAIWTNGDHRLVLTTSGGNTLNGEPGQSEIPVLQYSLSLEPLGADTFESDNPGEG